MYKAERGWPKDRERERERDTICCCFIKRRGAGNNRQL